jgi:hypothetical protein
VVPDEAQADDSGSPVEYLLEDKVGLCLQTIAQACLNVNTWHVRLSNQQCESVRMF